MPLFSQQTLRCCICGREYQTTCNDGTKWANSVCGMRCHFEKEWRRTLSLLGAPYKPDTREYDASGYPIIPK